MNTMQPLIAPAVQNQLQSQIAFATNCSETFFGAAQKLIALNIQVLKTVFAESVENSRQMMELKSPEQFVSHVSGQAMPAMLKMRAYQQHVAQIVSDTQSGLTRTAQATTDETVEALQNVATEVATAAHEQAVQETPTARVEQKEDVVLDETTASIKESLDRVVSGTASIPV